ncbi:sugar phosphate nucleotidyltransferase, partial [Vibrio parahaemolyticus]
MFKVDSFVEKPKLELAEKYVESGEYYWNSGMFMFKASKYLDELKRYRPEIYQSCKRSLEKVQEDCDFIRVDQDEFKNCPDDSIDYAVMENTNNATVIPVSVGWSDIGSWSALWDKSFKDDNQNVQSGDIISVESYGNYLRSESKLV